MDDELIIQLKEDVATIGEVHAVIEEHEKDLEVREGQVTWDHPTDGSFAVETRTDYVEMPYDRVIRWYVPDGVWH